jgi:hypothetical protein
MSQTKKITSLTDEQEARIGEFVERWTRIGLCTDPADRPRAEAAIRDMYRQGGLEPPTTIVWCGSPLSQFLTGAIILDSRLMESIGRDCQESVLEIVQDSVGYSVLDDVYACVGDSVGVTVRDGIRDSVWYSAYYSFLDSIADNVRTSVWGSVENSVENSVLDSVATSVWCTVWDTVWDRIYDSVATSVRNSVQNSVQNSVRDSVRDRIRDSVWDSIHGAHDAHEFALYRCFHDVVGLVDETSKLSGLWELAQSAGWALPYRSICWVSERHHILSRDERGRLHCDIGPAVEYPDGWAIYASHGVRVPRYVIEHPKQIDIARIETETNAEVRRVMIERYRQGEEINGGAAYIRDCGATLLDHDERYGTLWRRDLPNDEPIVMIEVVNSTPEPDGRFKRYWLRVPPGMTTAREAVAWTFDMPTEEYAPVKET